MPCRAQPGLAALATRRLARSARDHGSPTGPLALPSRTYTGPAVLGAMLAGIRFLRESGAIDKLDKLTSVLSDNSSLTFSPSACVTLRAQLAKVGVPSWTRRPVSARPVLTSCAPVGQREQRRLHTRRRIL